jgi:hypothetical protein
MSHETSGRADLEALAAAGSEMVEALLPKGSVLKLGGALDLPVGLFKERIAQGGARRGAKRAREALTGALEREEDDAEVLCGLIRGARAAP